MYKKIITLFFLGLALKSNSQNFNPFVAQGTVTPSPITMNLGVGTAQLSFIVGNSGDDNLPLVANQEMMLVISLSRGIPNNIDPLAAIGGSYASYFNWQYDDITKTYLATQNKDIPGAMNGGVGNITINYSVSTLSNVGSPQNGFNVNITPPAYSNGVNSVNDDHVSSYTYTLVPLPIWWKSLSVVPQDCSVRIDWTTSKEENVSHFEIQRKAENATDFETIETVKAVGNSNVENSYVYYDRNVIDGNYQYRIKSVDVDAKFQFTQVENVQIKCEDENQIYLFPNPTTENTNLVIRTTEEDVFYLSLTDLAGRVIYENMQELNNQVLTIIIPTDNLPNGVYNLGVKNSYDTKFFKVQKLK